MTHKRILVAIFAHPDDEAFGTGGTLAKYVHAGVEVHLVIATRGEVGRIANPWFWQETFILARLNGAAPRVMSHNKEDDLFAGVRQPYE